MASWKIMASWSARLKSVTTIMEWWIMLAVSTLSVFVLGWLTGTALGALPTQPCNRVYPAPPSIELPYGLGRWYTQPRGYEYIRCLRGQQ